MSSVCFVVGVDRPSEILSQEIENKDGNVLLKGEQKFVSNIKGDRVIPNVSKCWGKRVVNGKSEVDGVQVTVHHPKYTGDILFLKKNNPEGEVIFTRHLKGYNTLDKLFQEVRLNYKEDDSNEKGAEAFYITLENGDNEFDDVKDRLLVQHLKNHYLNGNCESNPDDAPIPLFYNKDESQVVTVTTKTRETKTDALFLVKECATTAARLKVLHNIVGNISDERPNDEQLYDFLLGVADNSPKEFWTAIENYKKDIQNMNIKADSFQAIDTSVDGIAVINEAIKGVCKKGDVLADGLTCKGKDFYAYLFENYLDEGVYEIQFKIKQITDKLK